MHTVYLFLSVLFVCVHCLSYICIILYNSPFSPPPPTPLMCIIIILLFTPVLFEEPSLIASYQQIYTFAILEKKKHRRK